MYKKIENNNEKWQNLKKNQNLELKNGLLSRRNF